MFLRPQGFWKTGEILKTCVSKSFKKNVLQIWRSDHNVFRNIFLSHIINFIIIGFRDVIDQVSILGFIIGKYVVF